MSSKAMAMRLQEIPKYLQQTLTVANAKSAMDVRRKTTTPGVFEERLRNVLYVLKVFRKGGPRGWCY